MKKLTAEQIQMNWETLMDIINKHISGDRKENLIKMYDDFKDRLNRVLPNRTEFFISNSGHLPHMENQDEFESILFKYLNSNQ